MPPGKIRVALGAEMGILRGKREASGTIAVPVVGMRVGVAPRTELRGRVGIENYEGGVNVQAVDGERVDLLLMPSYFQADVDDIFDEEPTAVLRGFAMPAVVGVALDAARRHHVFVAPDVRVGTRNREAWGAAGVHIGASFAGPADHGAFIPECAWLVGFGARAPRDVYGLSRLLEHGGHSVTCSLGVTLGGNHMPR